MLLYLCYALIFLGLAATLFSLIAGLITMGRGGSFNDKFGNRFMRFRLYAQAAAVLGVVGVFALSGSFG